MRPSEQVEAMRSLDSVISESATILSNRSIWNIFWTEERDRGVSGRLVSVSVRHSLRSLHSYSTGFLLLFASTSIPFCVWVNTKEIFYSSNTSLYLSNQALRDPIRRGRTYYYAGRA
jgi:hypothetical protein